MVGRKGRGVIRQRLTTMAFLEQKKKELGKFSPSTTEVGVPVGFSLPITPKPVTTHLKWQVHKLNCHTLPAGETVCMERDVALGASDLHRGVKMKWQQQIQTTLLSINIASKLGRSQSQTGPISNPNPNSIPNHTVILTLSQYLTLPQKKKNSWRGLDLENSRRTACGLNSTIQKMPGGIPGGP